MRNNNEIWSKSVLWMAIICDLTIQFLPHGLWVLLRNRKDYGDYGIQAANLFQIVKGNRNLCSIRNMGGKRKRSEPENYQEQKEKPNIQDILVQGKFTGFMERLKGSNLFLIKKNRFYRDPETQQFLQNNQAKEKGLEKRQLSTKDQKKTNPQLERKGQSKQLRNN